MMDKKCSVCLHQHVPADCKPCLNCFTGTWSYFTPKPTFEPERCENCGGEGGLCDPHCNHVSTKCDSCECPHLIPCPDCSPKTKAHHKFSPEEINGMLPGPDKPKEKLLPVRWEGDSLRSSADCLLAEIIQLASGKWLYFIYARTKGKCRGKTTTKELAQAAVEKALGVREKMDKCTIFGVKP